MRTVQITEFGGPELLDVVDLPDPVPGDGGQLFDVPTAGVDDANTHRRRSRNRPEPPAHPLRCDVVQVGDAVIGSLAAGRAS